MVLNMSVEYPLFQSLVIEGLETILPDEENYRVCESWLCGVIKKHKER